MVELNREELSRLLHELLGHSIWREFETRYSDAAVTRARRFLKKEAGSAPGKQAKRKKEPPARPGAAAGSSGRVALYCDGGSKGNPGPAGGGGEIVDEAGIQLATFSVFFGKATNNVAEYKALIEGIDRVVAIGLDKVDIRLDSELLVMQIRGLYKVKSPHLVPLYRSVMERLGRLDYTIAHVPREENLVADKLANRAIADHR